MGVSGSLVTNVNEEGLSLLSRSSRGGGDLVSFRENMLSERCAMSSDNDQSEI